MADASSKPKSELAALNDQSKDYREGIIKGWSEADGKSIKTEEGTITRRTSNKAVVDDENALLKHCLDNFEKMPFTINWDTKTMATLVDAGAIPKDMAQIEEKYTIAVSLEDRYDH